MKYEFTIIDDNDRVEIKGTIPVWYISDVFKMFKDRFNVIKSTSDGWLLYHKEAKEKDEMDVTSFKFE